MTQEAAPDRVGEDGRDQAEIERGAHSGWLLLQDEAGEEDGEEGLRLDDDRRQPGRHPVGDTEEPNKVRRAIQPPHLSRPA